MAIETSVEHEYFSNPTKEQVSALKDIVDNDKGSDHERNDSDSGSASITMSAEPPTTTETNNNGVLADNENNKTISYIDKDEQQHNFSQREWEDEWNKNKVENQWQNLGRSKDDMYDRDSGLDFNGNKASEALSSIGVTKDNYLLHVNDKNKDGDYLYAQQAKALQDARKRQFENAKNAAPGYNKLKASSAQVRNEISKLHQPDQQHIENAQKLAKSNLGESLPDKQTAEQQVAEAETKAAEDTKVETTPELVVGEAEKISPVLGNFASSYVSKVGGLDDAFIQILNKAVENPAGAQMRVIIRSAADNLSPSAIPDSSNAGWLDTQKSLEIATDEDGDKIVKYNGPMTTPKGGEVVFSVDNNTETGKISFIDVSGDKRALDIVPGNGVLDPVGATNWVIKDGDREVCGIVLKSNSTSPEQITTSVSRILNILDTAVRPIPNPNGIPAQTVTKQLQQYLPTIEKKEEVPISKEEAPIENTQITTSKEALKSVIDSFENGKDREAVADWYGNYNTRIETVLSAEGDALSKAKELSDILDEAKEALTPYSNGNFNNFSKAANAYVASVAGSYFIQTQLTKEGVVSDDYKSPNFISRVKDAFNADNLSALQRTGYALFGGLGYGKQKPTEEQVGTNRLREIAIDSMFRSGKNISNEFKGAVLSSITAQAANNEKSTTAKVMRGVLAGLGSSLLGVASGNPLVAAAVALYNLHYGSKVAGEIVSNKQRQADNEERLQSINEKGVDRSAMPATKTEQAYGSITSGTGKDIMHLSAGLTNIALGLASANMAVVGSGVYELMQLNSLKQEVDKFVAADEGLKQAVAQVENESSSETKTDEVKKRKKEDLEVVEGTGIGNDDISGVNLPGLDEETLAWLIRQPQYKNIQL